MKNIITEIMSSIMALGGLATVFYGWYLVAISFKWLRFIPLPIRIIALAELAISSAFILYQLTVILLMAFR